MNLGIWDYGIYVWMCLDVCVGIFGYVWIYLGMFGYILICLDIFDIIGHMWSVVGHLWVDVN